MRVCALFSLLVGTAAYDLDYFDNLRKNQTVLAEKSPANPDRLWKVTDGGETFQLAQITAFLPFSDGFHFLCLAIFECPERCAYQSEF